MIITLVVESIGGNYYIGQAVGLPFKWDDSFCLKNAVHIATPNRINSNPEIIKVLELLISSYHIPVLSMREYYEEIKERIEEGFIK